MNRRGFLRSLVGAAAVVPAVRTWPFRTFFFPPAPMPTVDFSRLQYLAWDPEELVWYPNPEQAAAYDELTKRVVALELEQMRAEIPHLMRQSGMIYMHYTEHERIVTWNNLQRSPIRWSSRNDPLRFA